MKPPRIPLYGFADVVLHAPESTTKSHPAYTAAKTGDVSAADVLVAGVISAEAVDAIRAALTGPTVELVPIHALESEGVNEIPAALATELSGRLALRVNRSIVQLNSVGHTGASGFWRLAHQALFSGIVERGKRYFLIDDFIGQGGTLANLIGYIHSQGGVVVGATVLTGKPYSANLAPDRDQIAELRIKHGPALEEWWRQNFGFGFECLTRSEARYLEKTADAATIRSGLVEAGLDASP
jgi:hypothetical protein